MPLLSESTITLITTYAVRVGGALLLLFAAWMVAAWLRRAIARNLERANFDLTLTKFFGNAARYLMLVIAVLGCLEIFGVQATSFAAVLAAAGFAVGLAFQNTLSNFSAGIMLLTFRPFKVGDVVNIAGHTGKVDEIELFTTKIDTFDNRRIIVPNSAVFGSTIENITFHDTRRVDVSVGTDYPADLDRTRTVLETAANGVQGVLPDKDVQVVLDSLGDSAINWEVRVWSKTADFLAVKQALTRAIKMALDEAEIGIPFPQVDMHLDGALARLDTNGASQSRTARFA